VVLRYFCRPNAACMLTKKEIAFIEYWEKAKNRQKKLIYQLAVGLPVGLLFGMFIIMNFYSGWYKRAEMIANSRFNPMILYVAVIIIAVFFAIFSKKFQYEQLDQKYRELLAKRAKQLKDDDNAAI
jgi:uncharacterized membrane protein (DUF106 family)